MREPVKPRRRYSSPKREQQASETRQAILSAARALFAERGYSATTVEAIAEGAGVAVPTVYAVLKSKRAILFALLVQLNEQATIGDIYDQMMREPDPRQQLRLAARISRQQMEVAGDLIDALRSAGAAEREFQTIWRRLEQSRREGVTALVQLLDSGGHLAEGQTQQQATDVIWSLGSNDLYHLLVVECGWTGDAYEQWLGTTLATLLLR